MPHLIFVRSHGSVPGGCYYAAQLAEVLSVVMRYHGTAVHTVRTLAVPSAQGLLCPRLQGRQDPSDAVVQVDGQQETTHDVGGGNWRI